MANLPFPSTVAVEHASECYRTYNETITADGRQPTPAEQRHLTRLRYQCMLAEDADLWRKELVTLINRGRLTRHDEIARREFYRAYGDLVGLKAEELDSAA